MLDILTQILGFVDQHAAALQFAAVAITLVLILWQTVRLGRQVRLASLTTLSDHNREVNELILQDEYLRRIVGVDRDTMLAFILLNGYQLRYFLRGSRLIETQLWGTTESAINFVVARPFVRRFWERYRSQYDPRFAEFIGEKMEQIPEDTSGTDLHTPDRSVI